MLLVLFLWVPPCCSSLLCSSVRWGFWASWSSVHTSVLLFCIPEIVMTWIRLQWRLKWREWIPKLSLSREQYASKFGTLSSGHRTGKSQFSFQSQRRAMLKNVQTTAQLHSTHKLAKYCQNSPSWLQEYMNWELPDVQTRFRKGRGTRDQIANIRWIIKKAEFQKNIYFCFIDYAEAFDRVDHNQLWKSLKEIGIPDHLTCLLRNLYAGQETAVRTA